MEVEKEDLELAQLLEPEATAKDNLDDGKTEVVDSNDGITTPKEKEEKPPAPLAYTVDELKTLSVDDIDVNRLPVELQAKYRAMQAPITRRQQELANTQREYEQRLAQTGQPKTIGEAFQKDPVGFMHSVDNTILQLESQEAELRYTDPEKATEKAQQIVKAKEMRNNLVYAVQEMNARSNYQNQVMTETITTLRKEIPDFEKRVEVLTDFAMSKGVTRQSLQYLTDPLRVGKEATIFATKIFNELYDLLNANKKGEAKLKKEAPSALARGGGKKEEEGGGDDKDRWGSVKNVDKYLKSLGV